MVDLFEKGCYNCKYDYCEENSDPCIDCVNNDGDEDLWEVRPNACKECIFNKSPSSCEGCYVKIYDTSPY